MDTGPTLPFTPSTRLPDPRIEILDERGLALRLMSGTVEQLAGGFYWAEGPVWFGDGRYLLFSDIPNNRILRWDDCSGALSTFRAPSNHANGLGRDHLGRLLACEHGTRRVTRTEHDGRITVLADQYQGKRLNSPNDIVCQMQGEHRGAIWFTDPPFGILGWWEGEPATPELPHGVYRIDPASGDLTMVLDDLQGSNGLAFSPDETVMYVVESRAKPHRVIWAYDVVGATLKNKRLYVSAQGPGAYDGIAVDQAGNVWCGFGSDGSVGTDPDGLDGVRVYDPEGRPLLHVHLPERCANLCFGGPKRNRLFMAASHSLYALHVNARGAVA
ncbi:MAG: SMP-30/gluconolactonase/LRE family protein [Burkholderiaceae bacterium]|nr:SMP-30/gluconolactonase/LRE family protein [Burkholderiaceae bacterium]